MPTGTTNRWKWPVWGHKENSGERSSFSEETGPAKWSFGVLNDQRTIEVPGSVLLLAHDHNEPLGLRNVPARTSHSSIPAGYPVQEPSPAPVQNDTKKTPDGKIILEPQPEDSANDPLNWPAWRRDASLFSLGLYCMLGGGLTTVLAAGFTNVADDYNVDVSSVSLTTGLYMLGMGVGSVIFSPTAILWGKRPVYLFSAVILILTSVWCALSPNFSSLIVARVFQGIAVSPVECLPSATIAEIFFLHERAFRIGIYTLLLLGGKNLVPLVSAAVIGSLSWRWVFWVVALIVAFCGILLFFFVPETFWDRTPTVKKPKHSSRPNLFSRLSSQRHVPTITLPAEGLHDDTISGPGAGESGGGEHGEKKGLHEHRPGGLSSNSRTTTGASANIHNTHMSGPFKNLQGHHVEFVGPNNAIIGDTEMVNDEESTQEAQNDAQLPGPVRAPQSAHFKDNKEEDSVSQNHSSLKLANASDAFDHAAASSPSSTHDLPQASLRVPGAPVSGSTSLRNYAQAHDTDSEKQSLQMGKQAYTHALRDQPALTFVQQLRVYHGRLNKDQWLKIAIRPLILFAYPSVLWSAVVYACSVGWLIVISESVAVIYRNPDSYNFTALQTGLVYLSPFIGGILGTAGAGKVSDVIVKAMARRNGGLYEPEFRLVMAAPIAVTTVMGLMGFGWSVEEKDRWIIPTVFFGMVSFGCTLGSTTSITFCVDSYRQYAGEALVTLNFSKNVFHGLVFSLFVTQWLDSEGPKEVFIWLGVIQLILLFFSVPMFIYGKRARMWTVRRNLMEKF